MKEEKKLISLRVGKYEEKLIEDLQKLGLGRGELLRAGIRLLHKKEFPLYAAKEKIREADLSPRELCEKEGGKVIEKNGVKKCLFQEKDEKGKVFFEREVPLEQYGN